MKRHVYRLDEGQRLRIDGGGATMGKHFKLSVVFLLSLLLLRRLPAASSLPNGFALPNQPHRQPVHSGLWISQTRSRILTKYFFMSRYILCR